MKKIFFIFTFYIISISICLGSNNSSLYLESLFDTKNKSEIVYYNGAALESSDYVNSLKIKESLLKTGNEVYSITIADVLGGNSNQYIAIFQNIETKEKKIAVYSAHNVLFEYKVLSNNDDVKIALDLETFKNKNKNVGVIKLYLMNEYENKKTVDLHLFIAYNNKISLISNIQFYNEVKTLPSFVSAIDIVFADLDNDGALEMLVSSSQKIAGRNEKIEYITYKFDYKINNYVCIGSAWYDEAPDYSVYFN